MCCCTLLTTITMLHSIELRIGNAVTITDLQNIESSNYRPLLINAARMYQLGFMDDNYYTWEHEFMDFNLVMIDDSYYQYFENPENKIGKPMLYVHEMQNRCSSMTGGELIMRTDERPVSAQ